MQLAQRDARIDAQLVGERAAQPGVHGKSVGCAALPGESDHQMRVEILPPWPLRQHVDKRGHDQHRSVRRTIGAELNGAPPLRGRRDGARPTSRPPPAD